MRNPSDYEEIKDKITDTLFSFESDSIVKVLSDSCSIGPIIPSRHIDHLLIKEAIDSLSNDESGEILEEIHNTFNPYFSKKIRIFNSMANDFINEEDDCFDIDKEFLWYEKYYYEMFGLWSPRMIVLDLLDEDLDGKNIYLYKSNFKNICYCPLKDGEVEFDTCQKCPFFQSNNANFRCKYIIGI